MGLLSVLTGGEAEHIRPASEGYFSGERFDDIMVTKEVADLPDFSEAVKMLGKSENKVWQNSNPDAFKKNGKINFLHLNPNGVFILTIIKPGSQTILTTKIPREKVGLVRQKLIKMQDWDKSSSAETWDKADGDKDGNTYMFHRGLTIFEEEGLVWKLLWEGRHKNRGNIVEVRDQLRFVKVPPIILGKK